MGIFKRYTSDSDANSPDSIPTSDDSWKDAGTEHRDTATATGNNASTNFKVSKTGDGDVALALFSSPDDAKEPIDPLEEKKVVRKIDFMILPYLAVCYA